MIPGPGQKGYIGSLQAEILSAIREKGEAHGMLIADIIDMDKNEVYPPLRRLLKRGLIDHKPPFYAPESRGVPRKVYFLTEKGRAALEQLDV